MDKKYYLGGIILGTLCAVLTPNTLAGVLFSITVGIIGMLIAYMIDKKYS